MCSRQPTNQPTKVKSEHAFVFVTFILNSAIIGWSWTTSSASCVLNKYKRQVCQSGARTDKGSWRTMRRQRRGVNTVDGGFGSLSGLVFSVILHVPFPLSAYISLNAPLYPIPSSIYLPPSVIRPLISALAPLYCNSTLLTVSLIYLSSPFSKGHYTHSLFCQIKIEACGKEDEVCHMCQPPTLSNAQHTHIWMQMRAHTHTHTHTQGCRRICMLW